MGCQSINTYKQLDSSSTPQRFMSPSGTRTPPPSGPPPSVGSSPVSRITKYFVAHKRDEFQAFGYDETIHEPKPFPSSEAFLKFLSRKKDVFRAPDTTPVLSMDDFITTANAVAASIQKDRECYLLCLPSSRRMILLEIFLTWSYWCSSTPETEASLAM